MLNKTNYEDQNPIRGGKLMKCSFCGKKFEPVADEDVCENCIHSVDELTNGKEENEDE
jgi:predicted amidophosphoribosyltransferase